MIVNFIKQGLSRLDFVEMLACTNSLLDMYSHSHAITNHTMDIDKTNHTTWTLIKLITPHGH